MPGLVLLRTVIGHYATGRQAENAYQLDDLRAVAIAGGNLESFQNTWETVISGMRKVPDLETQEYFLSPSHPFPSTA